MKTSFFNVFPKIFITIGFFWFAISKFGDNKVNLDFRSIKISYVIYALFILQAQFFLSAFRWFRISQILKTKLSFKHSFFITLISQFFNQMLPSSFGGDAFKIWAASKKGLSLSESTSSVICDRIFGVVILILILGVSLFLLPENWKINISELKVLFLTIFGFISFISFITYCFKNHLKKIILYNKLFNLIRYIFNDTFVFFRNIRKSLEILFLSLIIQLSTIYIFYILALSTNSIISFFQCFILIPIVLLISMIPISIAGWGIREFSIVILFNSIGIDKSQALMISILYGLLHLSSALPGFFLWLADKKYFSFDQSRW